jgi:hypothetical protein
MNNQNFLKSALIPSLLIGVVLVGALSVIRKSSGLWGSLLGLATVILFLSVHLIIQRISADLEPIAVMALAMFSYFAKVALMGAFLIIITKTTSVSTVDRPSFAITSLSVTVIWLAAEIRAYLKLKPQLPLPKQSS